MTVEVGDSGIENIETDNEAERKIKIDWEIQKKIRMDWDRYNITYKWICWGRKNGLR